jgi:beta-lactamase superfamily II metal-dependent hydrolase
MDTLQIRIYNVLFGDAILVSVPDRNKNGKVETRHILFDVGNVILDSKGGADTIFKPIVENILKVLDGKPLDLYVMTHEHLDHVQGLPYAEKNFFKETEGQLRGLLKTKYVWLTGSSAPDYYEKHLESKKQQLNFNNLYSRIERFLKSRIALGETIPTQIATMWANNNPRKTADCVKYLRELGEKTYYSYRGFDTQKNQPFNELKIEIWAPEENTADYYRKRAAPPLAFGENELNETAPEKTSLTRIIPPSGVDAKAFYDLVDMRTNPYESLLNIDQAANNTSLVLCLEWRGYRLLFAGDAEEISWRKMNQAGVLKPVHFLKVSHHGSYTGTPEPELLEKILPIKAKDKKPRYTAVSTCLGSQYQGVPDEDTLNLIRNRCDRLYATNQDTSNPGEYFDVTFEA